MIPHELKDLRAVSGAEVSYLPNPWRTEGIHPSPARAAYDWHRAQPEYVQTPLVSLDRLATEAAFQRIWAKDESSRLGMNSFKILGGSWAIDRALNAAGNVGDLEVELLVAATDGNHGRAVAAVAHARGYRAEIIVPCDTPNSKIEAIEAHGAAVVVVPGNYDEAVATAAERANLAGDGALLVSDTALDLVDPVPAWIIDGYSTLFFEIEDALRETREPLPDLVLLPIGVGGLAAAGVRWFRSDMTAARPRLIGVEPSSAACMKASVEAGRPATLTHAFDSEMIGLNAGTPSLAAWQDIKHGMDGLLAISDAWCPAARRYLEVAGIGAGATGVAGLAGLLALLSLYEADTTGAVAWIEDIERPLVIMTEGKDSSAASRTEKSQYEDGA
jgi:diaminopropionate ammonia-lyase